MGRELKDTLAHAGIDVSGFDWFRSAPDPIASLEVDGAEAVAVWRKLRALTASTGHYPVLVGDEEDLSTHNEAIDSAGEASTASIIEATPAALDPVAWAREHLTAEADDYGDDVDEYLQLLEGEPETWPDGEPMQGLTIPTNISTGEPRPRVSLLLVPTQISWHVPAYLRFGAWNDCPPTELHGGLMRAWERQYGAQVAGISHDVVEMIVERPPTTRAEASRLAVVQFAYCRDIVEQGVGTVEDLAATLLNAPYWFFWWD